MDRIVSRIAVLTKTNAWNINRSTRWKLFRARISDIQVNFRGERWSSRDERYASFFKGIVIGNVRKISMGVKYDGLVEKIRSRLHSASIDRNSSARVDPNQ